MSEEHEVLDGSAVERLIRIGGAKLATQMMQLFLEHGPERMTNAEAGFAAGDLRKVEHASHSLKSSAGNIGAHRLQHAAAALEVAAENAADAPAAPNDVAALVGAMRAEYDTATAAITTRLAELST